MKRTSQNKTLVANIECERFRINNRYSFLIYLNNNFIGNQEVKLERGGSFLRAVSVFVVEQVQSIDARFGVYHCHLLLL